uniref:Uncharacterized protein n=1 Tax=Heterorhabditis bacteriophora TaxID=37862 RepID=A0A1I7WGL5_HETBA
MKFNIEINSGHHILTCRPIQYFRFNYESYS